MAPSVSSPTKSASVSGPIGCPAPAFIAWSISSIEPTPSSYARIASSMYGTSRRLTMKPALSFVGIASLPSESANRLPISNASSDVVTARTTSTSFITCGGLKKCSPRKRSGRPVTTAWSITASDEVLVANTASGEATGSTSRHISRLTSRPSVIASTTRSQPARSR